MPIDTVLGLASLLAVVWAWDRWLSYATVHLLVTGRRVWQRREDVGEAAAHGQPPTPPTRVIHMGDR